MQKNYYRPLQKYNLKKNAIENMVLIIIKHLKMNSVLALYKPEGIDMLLNK